MDGQMVLEGLENEVLENTPNVVFWFKKGDGRALYRKNPVKWVMFVRALSASLNLGWAARYYKEDEALPDVREATEKQIRYINTLVGMAYRARSAA